MSGDRLGLALGESEGARDGKADCLELGDPDGWALRTPLGLLLEVDEGLTLGDALGEVFGI